MRSSWPLLLRGRDLTLKSADRSPLRTSRKSGENPSSFGRSSSWQIVLSGPARGVLDTAWIMFMDKSFFIFCYYSLVNVDMKSHEMSRKGALVTLIENMGFIEHPCQPVHKRKGWSFMGKKAIRKILNEIVMYDSLVCIHNRIRPLMPLGWGWAGSRGCNHTGFLPPCPEFRNNNFRESIMYNIKRRGNLLIRWWNWTYTNDLPFI